jgi:hypothetical protein
MIRFGLAVLTAIAATGCKSDGTGIETGEIAIALNPAGAFVFRGAGVTVTATITRSGGFTGAVEFGVSGNPAGVTAVVSNEVTNNLITMATIAVTVGAAVPLGTHTLVVTGTGSGITAATANFALTVTDLAAR